MKSILTSFFIFLAGSAFANHQSAELFELNQIGNSLQGKACKALNLNDKQKQQIGHIMQRARAEGKKMHKAAIRIHNAYAKNVSSDRGNFRRAKRISRHAVRLVDEMTQLKMDVANSILFRVMNGKDQRMTAVKCMHEHKRHKREKREEQEEQENKQDDKQDNEEQENTDEDNQ